MSATERFEMVMAPADKELLLNAASMMGTTMANFVRMAARERAQQVIEEESRIVMTTRDFKRFANALSQPLAPNPALRKAMQRASKVRSA